MPQGYHITGRMAKDAEQKPNNGPVVVAIEVEEYNFKTKTRTKAIIECNAWGQTAQTLLNYAGAGALISATGRVAARDYTDRNGVVRHSQDIVLNEVEVVAGQPANKRAPGYSLVPQQNDDDSSSW